MSNRSKFYGVFSLIAMLFSLGVARADETFSPEFTLVEGAIALSGQPLSQSEFNSQATALVRDYEKNAEAKDQAERFQQALVDLNVATAAQAAKISQDIMSANNEISHGAGSQDEINQKISEIVSQAKGAQFSKCSVGLGVTAGATFMTGFILGFAGDSDAPTHADTVMTNFAYPLIGIGVVLGIFEIAACTS